MTTPTRYFALAGLLAVLADCRQSADAGAHADATLPSTTPPAASPVTTAWSDSPTEGPTCSNDADCKDGTVCFYVTQGCSTDEKNGRCKPPEWSHECAKNVPMCSCAGKTIWGKNCAGVVRERWAKLGACADF